MRGKFKKEKKYKAGTSIHIESSGLFHGIQE